MMTLLEPAVALTDLGLTLENVSFVVLLMRRANGTALRRWFVLLFASLALAAVLGLVSHGFLADKGSRLHQWVWVSVLLAIGATGLSTWAIGAYLQFSAPGARRMMLALAFPYCAYVLLVLAGYDNFGVAIAGYVPAAVFLFSVLLRRLWRKPTAPVRAGVAGAALTFIAVGVQQFGIGLHPVHFNHNALYHLIQALSLWLMYIAARGLLQTEGSA
jgi:hypothetical protein